LRIRETSAFTGVTTKKYTATATSRKATRALIKSPTANAVPFRVKVIEEKSGLPTNAAIRGVSRSLVKAVTTVAKAAPMTTPTAMSHTMTRRMNLMRDGRIRQWS